MSNLRNPFHTLYATEGINELDFPAIFSPTLIPLVLPLFQPGNVMLSGTQGTGKSMLLALLDTDIRLAFWKHEKHPFPVESAFCGYVGASINLSNSLVLKFTERDFGGEDSIACSDNECVDCLSTESSLSQTTERLHRYSHLIVQRPFHWLCVSMASAVKTQLFLLKSDTHSLRFTVTRIQMELRS